MKNRTQTLLFDNRKLAALLIPLALDQLLNSFMGSVDTFVVSNLGSAAISAVSLVDSINMLIVQAFFALASGGTVVCSHYLGLRNREHANGAARQLVFITLFMSVVITVLCLIFNHQILRVIFGEVEPEVMEKARQYFFISAVSYPFIALYDDGASILRAQENSRFPMMISVAANGVNLALNLLFVWKLHLGVPGSAFATLLARIFSMIVVMIRLRRKDLEIVLKDYLSIRPDWRVIRRILNIGIPSGVENGMFQFGKLAIQSTVSLMGTAAIAAQGMTNIIENLNGILALGVGVGLMTIVGETLGGRKKRRGGLLCEKTVHHIGGYYYRLMPCHVCICPPDHVFWRHGIGERKNVHLHGNMDHRRKAGGMGHVFYTCIWIPGGGRREIYHDSLCSLYVGLQGYICDHSGESIRHGAYGSVDRYVYGLDCEVHYLYGKVQKPQMAGAQGYLMVFRCCLIRKSMKKDLSVRDSTEIFFISVRG